MLTFYFDCSSPWTWLAFRQVCRLADEGVPVVWKPILVGGVFNRVNPTIYEQRAQPVPAKAAYGRKDLQDWARLEGVALNFPPSVFPVNSVKVMRACLWLEPRGLLREFAQAVFHAYWTLDQDISQPQAIAGLCAPLGIDPDELMHGIAQDDVKQRLHQNTEELIARGGFGSPTFFVGEHDMYFGNDRIGLVRLALEAMQRPAL